MALEDALVAILPPEKDTPVGAGLLVDRRLVLTCAHVVNAALGRTLRATGRPTKKVVVAFHSSASQLVMACVDHAEEAWSDPPATKRRGADICLLLLDSEVVGDIEPLRLGNIQNLLKQEFRVAGYPRDWDDVDFSSGEIVGREKHGLFVLRPKPDVLATVSTQKKSTVFQDEKRPPGIIAQGFSGGPVEVEGFIVGLLTQATSRVADATSYMIPVASFPQRVARLANRVVLPAGLPVRLEQPPAPHEPLVRTYLECLTRDPNPSKVQLSRSVFRQNDDESVQSPAPVAAAQLANLEPIEVALARENKIVLLGDPGMGKSTLLKYLEMGLASYTLSGEFQPGQSLVPVLIELKSYGGEKDLVPLLAQRVTEVLNRDLKSLSNDSAEATSIMKAWLVDGRWQFLFLFDAIDEVPSQFHMQIRTAIQSLLNYPHRFVISCRTAEYDHSLRNRATPFVLVGLQPPEIQAYLQQKLGAKAEHLFQAQIKPDSRLLTLASNPLLLEVMTAIVQQDAGVKLPRNHGPLLREFVRIMPLRRQREGFRPEVTPDLVGCALAKLGLEMLERQLLTGMLEDVRQWKVPCGKYDLETVLKTAKSWRLLSADGSRGEPVQFIHPLFREYFAASCLDARLKQTDSELSHILDKRVSQSRWYPTIVMLAGISNQPVAIVNWLARRLSADAISGVLFTESQPFAWLRSFVSLRAPTRIKLLMGCFEDSAAAEDSKTRDSVIDALQTIMHSAFLILSAVTSTTKISIKNSHRHNAEMYCALAVAALLRIGNKRALAELDGFIALDPTEQKVPEKKLPWSNFARLFQPTVRLFWTARRAAAEIRKKNTGDIKNKSSPDGSPSAPAV